MTDPTTILREAIARAALGDDMPSVIAPIDLAIADDVLATRIPQACQTCKGLGCTCPRFCERADDHICPDCPTIGTLLLWGWNVATAVTEGGQVRTPYGHLWMTAPNLLAALREVPT